LVGGLARIRILKALKLTDPEPWEFYSSFALVILFLPRVQLTLWLGGLAWIRILEALKLMDPEPWGREILYQLFSLLP
jgi:hypothetical protein